MADNLRQSVCVVVRRERGIGTRLKRLADIEDGKLVTPPPGPEEGWTMLYWTSLQQYKGPSKLGTLGVWEWFGTPHFSDPDKIFIISDFLPQKKAVRVFPVEAASPAELCETLQKHGVRGSEADLEEADLFFAYLDAASETYCGALLPAAECTLRDGRIYPVPEKVSLPIHRLPAADVFSADDMMVALADAMGSPISATTVGDADKLIEDSLVEALSWPYFKNHTGGNRLDWRTCKDLIHGLFTKSVKDKVSQELNISPEEADFMVARWVDKASNTAEFGSEDAQLMAAVAMRNDDVHTACMKQAASFWETEHADKLTKATEEIQQLNTKIAALKSQEAAARGTVEGLQKSAAAAQKTLSDINAKIASDTKLAEDTEKAVQKRIAQARKNMADFLAELSVIQAVAQPEPKAEPKPEPAKPAAPPQPAGFTYAAGENRSVSNRVVNPVRSWRDALSAVSRNLGDIVLSPLRTITAAYLYAAYLCGTQILAVGPCGQHLADAVSAALEGKRSGAMRLDAGCGYAAADALLRGGDKVVTLQNLFHSGAVDFLPQALEDTNRCLLWLHPYVEDLAVEPASLYSYMLPLLTEPLLIGKTMNFISFGGRSSGFSSFQPKIGSLVFEKQFQQLQLSPLVQKQVQKQLSTAAGLAEGNQADIELLFGLLPLCTALGRQDILQAVLREGRALLPEVILAVRRYTPEDSLS